MRRGIEGEIAEIATDTGERLSQNHLLNKNSYCVHSQTVTGKQAIISIITYNSCSGRRGSANTSH